MYWPIIPYFSYNGNDSIVPLDFLPLSEDSSLEEATSVLQGKGNF